MYGSFRKLADVPVDRDGYTLVTRAVANDGSLLFLFVEPAGSEAVVQTEHRASGIFPRSRMTAAKRFRLVITPLTGDEWTIELPALDVTFPLVDLFPDGRILIAGPRSAWRGADDYDLNGLIYDPATDQVSRMLLGDGINRLGIDGRGRIWVAYFDEGIFGNFGWGNPGPAPIGDAGLVCFSDAGEKLWYLSDDDMADCYALNVSGNEAAAYFYTEFPICRVSPDFKVTYWKTGLRGCHEVAISARNTLFSGQYKDAPDVGYLGTLEAGELHQVSKVRFTLPDGSGLPAGRLLGRGRSLYFFDASAVYRTDID